MNTLRSCFCTNIHVATLPVSSYIRSMSCFSPNIVILNTSGDLILMTLGRYSCQLVLMWLMTLDRRFIVNANQNGINIICIQCIKGKQQYCLHTLYIKQYFIRRNVCSSSNIATQIQ